MGATIEPNDVARVRRLASFLLALAAMLNVDQPPGAISEPLKPTGSHVAAMPSDAASCAATHVGIDTVGANKLEDVFNGRGEGQVVNLPELQITAFTVYLAAYSNGGIPYYGRLYVTNADHSGTPVVSSVLYEGPIVQGPFGDGVHPTPWTFAIDPPLTPPYPGYYYFNVIEATCFIGTFWLLADTTNRYPEGGEWRTGASTCDVKPGSLAGPFYPMTDLIFDVAMCPLVTPTRQRAWGDVKVIYR